MAILCGMPTIQYSARSAQLSVHRLFTSCIRRGLVTRDSIVDGDWLPATEWCQRYLPSCQLRRTTLKIWRGFLYWVYGPGNYFELIPTVEMEARHPVESYYGSEFPRSVIIAELWRPEVKIKIFREIFSFSWKKRPIQVKFSKLVPKVFIATPIDVLCSNFVKFGQRGNRWNRALLTWQKQKFARLSSCRYCADRAQNLPGPTPDNVLRVL